jgi:hypothetical protein
VIRSLPLRLRNRLAETIIAAPRDADARGRLERLAAGDSSEWLEPAEHELQPRLQDRARAARRALASVPAHAEGTELADALVFAAALFDAGLHFEVHEVLEPHWVRTADPIERDALQGVIQVAVGYQHFADGNVAGARSLLEQGGARLHGRCVLGVDLDPLARAAVAAAAALPSPPAPPRFPRVPANVTRS